MTSQVLAVVVLLGTTCRGRAVPVRAHVSPVRALTGKSAAASCGRALSCRAGRRSRDDNDVLLRPENFSSMMRVPWSVDRAKVKARRTFVGAGRIRRVYASGAVGDPSRRVSVSGGR